MCSTKDLNMVLVRERASSELNLCRTELKVHSVTEHADADVLLLPTNQE